MICDVNEEKLKLLAITACPGDLQLDGYCILDDEVFTDLYDYSEVDACRACWLKWLSESEDNYEK